MVLFSFRTKAIFSKRMRRLISISVNYMLGNRYISYAIIQGTLSVFPCGRTQHVGRMRSSIVNMIQSVFEFRFMHAIPHSRLNGRQQFIFQVISVLPFSAKNAFVTAHLLESSLAWFKNVACCFQTISCLLNFKEGNKKISSAPCLFSPLWKRTRSPQMYSPKTFPS